ncbi:MAG: SH3 domain-containing protein [Alphaproteobacteria bacterium]|nr:SH3 domain-containing protein [Alphaproteobacteria bacterium]MDP7456363.1 SH3 domain-containing protein [Alphaproteobacteria bacterium]
MFASVPPSVPDRVSRRHSPWWPFFILGAFVLGFGSGVGGQMMTAPPSGAAENALSVPRFVSLRKPKVNLRTGPGVRYPVEWVFVRRGIPVEIIAEVGNWRKVLDWEGTKGWVHWSMLSSRRTMVITGDRRTLRGDPSPEAKVVAQLEPGVYGWIEKCKGKWCRLEVAGSTGWLQRFEFWGVYPEEDIN